MDTKVMKVDSIDRKFNAANQELFLCKSCAIEMTIDKDTFLCDYCFIEMHCEDYRKEQSPYEKVLTVLLYTTSAGIAISFLFALVYVTLYYSTK